MQPLSLERCTQFSITFVALAMGALGCNGGGLSAPQQGYLASDPCVQNTAAASCGTQAGCHWIPTAISTTNNTSPSHICNGGSCPGPSCCPSDVSQQPGVCVTTDPCLSRDRASCGEDTGCAWSQVGTLCPVGATCGDGGFCHAKDAAGGGCACVSAIACPANGPCAPVECDCTGGGQPGGGIGGGGACTCACPACEPGHDCAPCKCDCDTGGPGCTNPGTCVCAGPVCAPNEPCPAYACACANGGAASASGSGGTVSSGDPCSMHPDVASCLADTANGCRSVQPPCVAGANCGPICEGTNTATKSSSGTSSTSACSSHTDRASCAGADIDCVYLPAPCPVEHTDCGICTPRDNSTCVCNCPDCPAGASCVPCACDCGTGGGMNGCLPPPTPTPGPTPIACKPAVCNQACTTDTKETIVKDASGCDICVCQGSTRPGCPPDVCNQACTGNTKEATVQDSNGCNICVCK